MANIKDFYTRIQHKIDTEENWNKAVNFVPLKGEIIIYDTDSTHDYKRIKIGDGVTTVVNLEFVADYDIDGDGVVDNAAKLGGNLPSYFITKEDYVSGSTFVAMQNKKNDTWYRLQLQNTGAIDRYESTDNGATWTITGRIAKAGDFEAKPIKHAYVGQSDNSATNPWYKIGYLKLDSTYQDRLISFKVSQGYGDNATYNGILTAHIRTTSIGVVQYANLVWEYANDGVVLSDFVLAYKTTAGTCVEAELWAKQDWTYGHFHFEVLSEHSRTNWSHDWILYTVSSAGQYESIPDGWTQVESTLATHINPLSTDETITSSKITNRYLSGNQGEAIINSVASAGSYVMLDKLNSTNGYFTDGVYQKMRVIHYTSQATVDAGTNSYDKRLILLDEDGNSTFPGRVTVSEGARTTRGIFNEETRASSTTGTLQSVKYFINVT